MLKIFTLMQIQHDFPYIQQRSCHSSSQENKIEEYWPCVDPFLHQNVAGE